MVFAAWVSFALLHDKLPSDQRGNMKVYAVTQVSKPYPDSLQQGLVRFRPRRGGHGIARWLGQGESRRSHMESR